MTPDDDPTTAEVTVVNASAGERVIVSRCVGVTDCEDCSTRPTYDEYGEFPLSDCRVLATVGPGGQWTSKQEPTGISTWPGEPHVSRCRRKVRWRAPSAWRT